MTSFARTRTEILGPGSRPVAIPDDVDAPGLAKSQGRIRLPAHVHWSGAPRTFDLADRHDRALVYELVLTEGTDDDVRRYIDVDALIELWTDLVLPSAVRRAWAAWLRDRRGVAVAC